MISIHALARRATLRYTPEGSNLQISIHALARRATKRGPIQYYLGIISIHALARRATCISSRHLRHLKNFNPRSRKESDLLARLQ